MFSGNGGRIVVGLKLNSNSAHKHKHKHKDPNEWDANEIDMSLTSR